MRKSPIWRGESMLPLCLPPVLLALALAVNPNWAKSQAPPEPPKYSVLVDGQIERLQAEVERIRMLVENGTLARISLQQAEERLADARDEGVLARTLYGSSNGSKPMDTPADTEVNAMVKAAQARVDRQKAWTDERQRLLASGAISRSEFETFATELESRRQVLTLAQNRRKLLEDIRQMAEAERQAERVAATAPGTLKTSMIRFDGNGAFSLADVPTIASQFERRFHHPLPVSALGQTLLHQSLELDHRNRVDVAIGPNSSEGLWLRALLERLHVPYLAFSSAVPGAATAPHIHIGVESTRLKSTADR